jgi:hypothetical protein
MAEPKKSMDVSKPENVKPDATSRPIIVGHKPMIQQDPMVSPAENQDTPPEVAENTEKKATSHSEKVVQPPSVSADAAEVADPKPEEPEAKSPEESDNSDDAAPVSDEAAIVDAVAEQAKANKKNSGEPTEEDKKKQAEITKLIEEKKYFVPLKVASHKRNSRLSMVFLVLLLLLSTIISRGLSSS